MTFTRLKVSEKDTKNYALICISLICKQINVKLLVTMVTDSEKYLNRKKTYIIWVSLLSCFDTGIGMCRLSLVIFWWLLHSSIWEKILRRVHRVNLQLNTAGMSNISNNSFPRKVSNCQVVKHKHFRTLLDTEKNIQNCEMRTSSEKLFTHQQMNQ